MSNERRDPTTPRNKPSRHTGAMKAPGHARRRAAFLGLAVSLAGALAGCAGEGAATPPQGSQDYVRGLHEARAGQKDAAIATLSGAIKANPDLTMARAVLGDLYYDKGLTAKAADQYEALTHLDPYNANNFYKLGMSYQLLDRLKESAASYLQSLRLDPHNASANMNLGLVYLSENDPKEAAEYLKRATVIDKTSAAAFANYGVALDALGQYADAEHAYRESIELDGKSSTTLLNLGSNLILQNRANEAATALRQSLALSDTPLAHKRLGDALVMSKAFEPAIREYQRALELDHRYYPAMNEIAHVRILEYRDGLDLDNAKVAAAVAMWRESLKLNPNQPNVQALLKQWGKGK